MIKASILLAFIVFSASVSSEKTNKGGMHSGRSETRRSTAEDDLDMAAAELVFKEKESLRVGADRFQGPLRKLPFETEHAKETQHVWSDAGAPSAAPTFSELQKSNFEDIENEKISSDLKSSMAGAGSEKKKEGFLSLEAPRSQPLISPDAFPSEVNKDQTSAIPAWLKPLPSRGHQVAFDFNINPDFPQSAPRARGLVGIPDGWNLDKQIDEEFRSGFRGPNFGRR